MNPPREEQIKQVFEDWRYDRSRTSGSIKYSFEVWKKVRKKVEKKLKKKV